MYTEKGSPTKSLNWHEGEAETSETSLKTPPAVSQNNPYEHSFKSAIYAKFE
jgi:hypothetical protein